ncbi:MAG: LapA family protein [Stenotrophobium sp.]
MLCLGASIGYFNAQPVTFNYLFGSAQTPLIALILGVFAVAVLLTLSLTLTRMFSLKTQIRQLRRKLHDNETELRNLRNLPVETDKK